MQVNRTSLRAMTALAVSLPALVLAAPAAAQDVDDVVDLPELPAVPSVASPTDALPPVPAPVPLPSTLPRPSFGAETTTGPDGIETITRTRRIASTAPTPHSVAQTGNVWHQRGPVAPAPVVFEREQWLEECRRRTNGRSEREKGGIIGSLLGAVAGGIIGNRVADGERLAGTLIGAGTGGLAGLLLGNLIGGGKKDGRYDCEAALDAYLSQPNTTFASRTIPAGGFAHPATVSYAPAYTGQYAYSAGCGCQQPQVVWVPVRTQQRQRVIVRETVREELVPAERVIPLPSPKLIKEQPAPRPVPVPARPTKLIKQ